MHLAAEPHWVASALFPDTELDRPRFTIKTAYGALLDRALQPHPSEVGGIKAGGL